MNLEGTQTLHNLMRAFAGESQARNRYTFAAQTAQAEGYQQIKNIFQETADNEKEHANVFYNYLVEGLQGNIPATVFLEHAGYPVFAGDTMENLNEAAHNEHEEWADIYPTFARCV